jgi:hypothetical protein
MKGRHMMDLTDEDRRRTAGRPYRREHPLPSTGAPSDRIYTQVNQDYPDDTDLCFERGSSVTMVRVTPADQEKLWAALGLLPVLATPARVQAVLEAVQRETTHAGDLAAVHRVMKMLRDRA